MNFITLFVRHHVTVTLEMSPLYYHVQVVSNGAVTKTAIYITCWKYAEFMDQWYVQPRANMKSDF
jgi:hypothetical protein